MPLGMIDYDTARSADLQARLTAEWRLPAAELQNEAPILIEDERPVQGHVTYQPLHLYVIWDEWAGLSQQERSEIIYHAFAETHSEHDVRRVTVAMGLTPAEAQKMGIRYKTLFSGGTNIK